MTAPGRSNLCDLCRKINFDDLYEPMYEPVRYRRSTRGAPVRRMKTLLGSIALFESCNSCALCSYIQQTDLEPYESSQTWGVSTTRVSAGFPSRPTFILQPRQLIVFVRQRKLDGQSQDHTIYSLDPCDLSRTRVGDYAWLCRRPVPGQFDVRMSMSWLQNGSYSMGRNGNRREDPFEKMQHIANLGIFKLADVHSGEVRIMNKAVDFVTLSCVWGHDRIKTEDFIRAPMDPQSCATLTLSALPRTLLDSIHLVRDIGEKYIWIDCICIDQSAHKEKELLISAMGIIHSAATLTIVAAAGNDVHAGLTRLTSISGEAEKKLILKTDSGCLAMLPGRPSFDDVIEATVWDSRGWTFQEQILSSRCVIFTSDEVLFTAESTGARESWYLEHETAWLEKILVRRLTMNITQEFIYSNSPMPTRRQSTQALTMRVWSKCIPCAI